MTNKIVIGAIVAAAFIAGTILSGSFVEAQESPGERSTKDLLRKTVTLLTNEVFGLEEIKNEVRNIEAVVLSDVPVIKSEIKRIIQNM